MSTPDRNAAQIDFWNGPAGERWVALQTKLDELYASLTTDAIAAAAPAANGHVLDIGCGCGATVLALAERVGPQGSVLGVDVSEPMLGLARRRVAAADQGRTELLLADASAQEFTQASFDLAFSRFGVMFFDDPAPAFRNIRTALKPGGRLFFMCWRAFKENPFFAVPHWAAKPHLPDQAEEKLPPDAPGPFALADPDRLRAILHEAGFSGIAIEPRDAAIRLAGSGELDPATDFIVQIGPVSRALATASEAQRAAAKQAVRAALVPFDGPDGISMPARVWFVSALN